MKMTKMEAFANLRTLIQDMDGQDELIEFIDTQMEQLAAKAEKARERAEKKKEDGDTLREAVKGVLTEDYQSTAMIMAALEQTDYEDEYTTAKVTARLTQLFRAGLVEKEPQKNEEGRKVMFYRLADPSASEEATEE